MLGAGAQKAGTTWVYRYLARSPEFVKGYRKEYHVFDALDLPSEAWTRRRIITLAEEALTELREGRPADAAVLHRMAMVGNPGFYYDYFAALLGDPRRHVTADVTPAYALLPVQRLREIRRELAVRDVRAVGVFLMRDPVDRIWSQLRMQHQRTATPGDPAPEAAMAERYAEPQFTARSEYHRTIHALDDAFDGDVHYEFYERLFTPEAVASLCAAVGVAMHPPDLDVRRNAAPAEAALPESTEAVVAGHLADVYAGVAERFPDVDLRSIWPSARHVL